MSLMQSQMDQTEIDQTTKDLLFLKVTSSKRVHPLQNYFSAVK